LSDETLARSIILGTYNIPTNMDAATKLILEEIGKLGVKIVNGEGNKIIVTPEDFKCFWQRVNEFTLSSMSRSTMDTTKWPSKMKQAWQC
jgi:hypothetical protein